VLCGGDQHAFFLQAGGIAYARYIAANRFNFKAVQINPAKDYAGSCRRRQDSERYRLPAMQSNSFAFHRSPNCLFKRQVIPTKQITSLAEHRYVVFLPQTVALQG
jgi:hypothetical protein